MLIDIEKSGEWDKEHSEEGLVSTGPDVKQDEYTVYILIQLHEVYNIIILSLSLSLKHVLNL